MILTLGLYLTMKRVREGEITHKILPNYSSTLNVMQLMQNAANLNQCLLGNG